MPVLFWLDVAAYAISMQVALVMALVVLGAGASRPVNRFFALFALTEAGWAVLALLLRMSLWLGVGNPQLLLELATLCFSLMAPFLLLFTVRYLGLPTRWGDRFALLEMAVLAFLTLPILRHQIVYGPYLSPVGTTSHRFTALGGGMAALLFLCLLGPLCLFWRERRRTRETYLVGSLFSLVFGLVVGGLLNPPVPVMSFTTTLSVAVLGYAITSRQILNPLRDLTRSLEQEVEKRTQELARRTAQLEALREVGLELAAELELDTLLRTIVSRAAELLAADVAGIYLHRPDADVLEWRFSSGDYGPPVGSVLRRGEGLSGRVWERGEPLIVNDYRHWKGRATAYDGLDIGAAMGVPIRWGETFFGVLTLGTQAGSPRSFSQADAELLSLFSVQAAAALESARLYEALQQRAMELEARVAERTKDLERRRTQLQVAARVARDATTAESLEELLERAVYLIRDRFGFYHAGIFLLDEKGEYAVLRAATGEAGRKMMEQGHKLRVGKVGIVGHVAAFGEPRIALDVGADAVHFKNPLLPYTRSEMALPLKVGDRILGALDVQSTQEAAFDEGDVATLQTMADLLAVAIERLRRVAEIQAEHARLEAILRSTMDGIIVVNRTGEVLHANPVVQRWLTQALTLEEAEELWKAVRELALRAEERPRQVLELKGLDLEMSAAPVVEEGVETHVVVVSAHDVTHLKALDRMKSRFITNISHELRTPATTIKLYAYLMQQQPERWREYLEPLAQEAERQASLVEDILQISRMDAGRLELSPEPTSLNELTQAAVESHQALAEEKGLELVHLPAEPGPMVVVDRWYMRQVWERLFKNALLYTPAGGRVEVATGREEAEGRLWATVRVSDTGIGIPQEELPHIFDRFFRGVEPRRMQISGTGLGLAIVKEIVELHGGRVTVESAVGKGSTFTVWLPLAGPPA